MKMPCYIFDIDGTLADCSHRLHHIQKEPKDWPAFYAACSDDKPIAHMIRLAYDVSDTNLFFVSGRSEECRDLTLAWLRRQFEGWVFMDSDLYMRKGGDHRDDAIVKLELLAQVRADGYEPIMVFEDRSRVVNAFRDAGIPCAQVASGDF